MGNRSICVIVPCYNEEDVIILFYRQVSEQLENLPGYDYKLLFVDDGSKDSTLEIIEGLAKRNERVKYISFSRNFGKESAMLAALKYTDSDCAIIMDADLQHPP